MKIETRIALDDAGQRADRYLRRYLAAMSLARIHSLFRKKEIKVNRKAIDRATLLAAGDVLEVYGLTPEQVAAIQPLAQAISSGHGDEGLASSPRSAPFPIVFEDQHLLVVDKPSGLAVHPGTGITPGRSLIELAQAYIGSRSESLFQPSLVHRLDRETSGLLLIAKSGGMLRGLTAALREGRLRKEYLALLEGAPEEDHGTLHHRLDRVDSAFGGAKSVVSEEEEQEGKEAITHFSVLERLGPYTWVRAIIETGRMHQIRAQFSHAGWPLAGDRRYGSLEAVKGARETLGLRRLFLHAEKLTWQDGSSTRRFHAGLPDDLAAALGRARAGTKG